MGQPLRLGLIGCGNISGQYLDSLRRLPNLRLAAVGDVNLAAAQAVADTESVTARDPAELLATDDIDAVLNLTTPQAHTQITLAALDAGKHVYLEKPIATTLADAESMVRAAQESGLRVGVAPDTVLGTGVQTARAVLDDGGLGQPVGATAFMLSPGHEGWHPSPAYYYQPGGGPLLDMGVYYLTALVTLLGPITGVSAMSGRTRSERLIPEGAPRAGEVIDVQVDTFVSAVLQHANGAISTLVVSFDVLATQVPRIEVYGTAGTLAVPDPNRFDGEVRLGISRDRFTPVPPRGGYRDAGRGYGLSDMARAIAHDQPHRQSIELGFHVYEVMERIAQAAGSGERVPIASTCERPAAVPLSDDPAHG